MKTHGNLEDEMLACQKPEHKTGIVTRCHVTLGETNLTPTANQLDCLRTSERVTSGDATAITVVVDKV